MPKKFYRNIVKIEVLTEGEPVSDDLSLAQIESEYTDGGWSAGPVEIESTEVSASEMADLLQDQGSSPDLFQIEDEGDDEGDDDICIECAQKIDNPDEDITTLCGPVHPECLRKHMNHCTYGCATEPNLILLAEDMENENGNR